MFSNLLDERKGFKYQIYQITVKILLEKYKHDGEIEFAPVYFNSLTKTVINNRFKLENAFQEILYRIDCWINKDLVGLLNQLNHNTLIFQLIGHY